MHQPLPLPMTRPPAELHHALRNGLGRALHWVKDEPASSAVRSALLHACCTNLIYDRVDECPRAPWLYRMIQTTGDIAWFRAALEQHLQPAQGNAPSHADLVQIFELLCLIARDDPAADTSPLHRFLDSETDPDVAVACIPALVRLEGIEAVLFCLERLQTEWEADLQSGGAFDFEAVIEALEARDGVASARSALDLARTVHPGLDRLLRLRAAAAEARAAERTQPSSHADIAAPTTEQLMQWAEALQTLQDPVRVRGVLQNFVQHDFPRPIQELLALVRHPDPRIRRVAIRAARRLPDPSVRHLAIQLLGQPDTRDDGLRLLGRQYRPGDLDAVAADTATRDMTEDEWHNLARAMLDVLSHAEVLLSERRPILLRLYEKNPCSFCRRTIVAALLQAEALPTWMAEECLDDADPGTRVLVRTILSRGPARHGTATIRPTVIR